MRFRESSDRFFILCIQENLEVKQMEESRIALVGIIVEDGESVPKTNDLLHEYSSYIVGRMGIPYRNRGISIISITMDAPEPVISALCGKLGQLSGVSVKSMLAKTGK